MKSAKEILDQLMGKYRNDVSTGNKKRKLLKYDDKEICPFFLTGLCPHELFRNTKSDLGPCPKQHDYNALQDFAKQTRKRQCKIEKKALEFYQKLVDKSDLKVHRAYTKSMTKHATLFSQSEQRKRRRLTELHNLEDQIEVMENEIEELGEKGRVSDAKRKFEMLSKYKKSYQRIKSKEFTEQRLGVCPICGAFKDGLDFKHYSGKQHRGFAAIRDKLETMEERHSNDPTFCYSSSSGSESRSSSSDGSDTDDDSSSSSSSRSRSRSNSLSRRSRSRSYQRCRI